MNNDLVGRRIAIRGIVQGVGFRPFIYNLAKENSLKGWVRNTSSGVEIEINGSYLAVESFLDSVKNHPPPLAMIDEFTDETTTPDDSFTEFSIITSQSLKGKVLPVSPDIAICPDCLEELFTPSNRRYRYPFINCTNCGPRFTIIQDIPYDRPKTTMAPFQMCPDCEAEYLAPDNRRFHAQPIACPKCGPEVFYQINDLVLARGEDAIKTARDHLKKGEIIAIKGLGGYHLACDASSSAAVGVLRSRKKRSDKPFALMAFDIPTIDRYCFISSDEQDLLLSRQRPIVLLKKRPKCLLPSELAPHQATLGVMLPYTPLHYLLLEPGEGFPNILVMTSGNLSDEPIAYQDNDARKRLGKLSDGFLCHDRDIFIRTDDSVARVINKRTYLTRRARGFTPISISMPQAVSPTLAVGGELKNTFCLANQKYAFLSHHIGDMENYETYQSFESGITHFEKLFKTQPELIACDIHPDYLSTRYAVQRAQQDKLSLIQVQHHHAHLASCLVDNHWNSNEPVLGICFDGTGMGTDNAIWGGEFLIGGYKGYERVFHLAYTPLPGGDMAIRKTSRMALAHLFQSGFEWEGDLPPVQALCPEERTALISQLSLRINTPLTSSMGRLFDAAAALMGVCQSATYEGQAAVELEALTEDNDNNFYLFEINKNTFSPAPLWVSLLNEWRSGQPLPVIATRFHNSIVEMIVSVCQIIHKKYDYKTVALSGGVWQNRYLLIHTLKRLEESGYDVLWHQQVPTNDGGISLGQVAVSSFYLDNNRKG